MNLEKDTWDIINTYYRDTPDYLVKHHLDSYNDFIINKIPNIFKAAREKTCFRTDITDTFIYETHITIRNFYISKPVIYDHLTAKMKQLYPNEARLKNLTYGADVFYDIDISFSMREIKTDKYVYRNVPIPNSNFLKRHYLGKIPIMLRSCLCVLQGMSNEITYQMGEGGYDVGGYFIIDGREKVIMSQERKAENRVFLNYMDSNNKFSHIAEVKSVSNEEFQPARTTRIQFERSGGTITVRLGQDKPFLTQREGRDVPLFIMFRLLGIESDKKILEYICHDLTNDLSQKMMTLLLPSINDPFIITEQIYDQTSAINYLENLPRNMDADAAGSGAFSDILKNKERRISYLFNAINENFIPHMGSNYNMKAHYLAYMVKRLLNFYIGIEGETDRDNFINKRIDLSGFLLAGSFRNALREMMRLVNINISGEYEKSHTEYTGEAFINIINERNYAQIFDAQRFQRHFIDSMKRGNITISTIEVKKGVVQSLERLNYYKDLSQLRGIVDPVPEGSVVSIDRRRLHQTQYGCVCPIETPEHGHTVGLRKQLAIMTNISFGCSPKELVNFIKTMELIELNDLDASDLYGLTKIFVNGALIGVHKHPQLLVFIMRIYRRNGLINIYTSISWNRETNEIYFYTDQGRFCRPLYIVENNELLLQPSILEAVKIKKYKWFNLISGFLKRKAPFNAYSCDIQTAEDVFILDKIDVETGMDMGIDIEMLEQTFKTVNTDILLLLHKNKGIIEFLDTEEFNTTRLASNLNFQNKNEGVGDERIVSYTHCELHPALQFGATMFLQPNIIHNASSRNVFSAAHAKQSIGVYTLNYNNRMDTSGSVLHYPQRPLIITRMNEIIHNDKMCHGMNAIIAITAYNGYNMEDAIIINRNSVDMGMYNSSLFKMYQDFEKVDKKTSTEERFYNPNEEPNITTFKNGADASFNSLDEYGFIKEGTYIRGDEKIFGKYIKYKDDKGFTQYRDLSTSVKDDHKGAVVDKVFTCATNSDKHRLSKVRVCQYRRPMSGDKFATRSGQKGTLGILLEPENMPYTKDGITPDFIFNPYGIVSRMTVAQLLEIIYGRLAVEMGYFGLMSPFETINPETIGDVLESIGLDRGGDTTLYNGITGEMIHTTIFMGPVYYQRIKHMVRDKINARASGSRMDGIPEPGGAYTALTRQTIGGRAFGGGIKIGEMERDALLSHGIFGFIKESGMERCDKYYVYVSRKTGDMVVANPKNEYGDNIYFNSADDGPVDFQMKNSFGDDNFKTRREVLGLDMMKQRDMDFVKVEIPFAMKLLIQEIEGMSISMKLKIRNEDISFSSDSNSKLNFNKLGILDDATEEELLEIQETQGYDYEAEEEMLDNKYGIDGVSAENVMYADNLDSEDAIALSSDDDETQDDNMEGGGDSDGDNMEGDNMEGDNMEGEGDNMEDTNNTMHIQEGGNFNESIQPIELELTKPLSSPPPTEYSMNGGGDSSNNEIDVFQEKNFNEMDIDDSEVSNYALTASPEFQRAGGDESQSPFNIETFIPTKDWAVNKPISTSPELIEVQHGGFSKSPPPFLQQQQPLQQPQIQQPLQQQGGFNNEIKQQPIQQQPQQQQGGFNNEIKQQPIQQQPQQQQQGGFNNNIHQQNENLNHIKIVRIGSNPSSPISYISQDMPLEITEKFQY